MENSNIYEKDLCNINISSIKLINNTINNDDYKNIKFIEKYETLSKDMQNDPNKIILSVLTKKRYRQEENIIKEEILQYRNHSKRYYIK